MALKSQDPATLLGKKAARLARSPSDLGAWWEVASALVAAGRPEPALQAWVGLGRAASSLGHAALAVACARALDEAGDSKAAEELCRHVAREHSLGSPKIDPSLRSSRPPPPPSESTQPGASESREVPIDVDAAVAAADKAVAAAMATAPSRAPDKLAPTALVGVLERDEVERLCSMMRLRRCAPGEVIVDVGEPASALYWIARGVARVTRGEHQLGELRPNQFFGEIALVLGGALRTACVTAHGPAVLLEIPAGQVEAVAAQAPRLARVLAQYARARLLASVMRTSELFSRLTEDERDQLLPMFDTEMFEAGDTVVANGSHNQCLYVVASGRCEVLDGGEVQTELQVGDGIGEMSLLARRPASFDVVAVDRTVLLSLSREKFDEVAVRHPGLLAEVYKLLVERENQNTALIHDASDLVV